MSIANKPASVITLLASALRQRVARKSHHSFISTQMQPPSEVTAPQTPSQSSGVSLPSLLARIGLVRLLNGPLGIIQTLPTEANAAYMAFSVTPRSIQAWADEGATLQQSLAQVDAIKTFGDLPLIVVSAGLNNQAGWQSMQAELLQLSSDSQQTVLEDSGHDIAVEQPEAAVAAIVQMVTTLR